MSNEEELNFWKMFETKVSIRENEIVIRDINFPKIYNNRWLLDDKTKEYIETSPFRDDYLEKNIYFENCKFHDFLLNTIRLDGKVVFSNCSFVENINFKNLTFNDSLGIHNCKFHNTTFRINNETSFNKDVSISGNKGVLNLELSLVFFNEGIFSVFVNDDLELFNFEMNSCIIYDKSYIEIVGNIFNRLVLNDIKNYANDFLIQHSTIKKELVIVDCLFNNTRFYNLNLINCLIDASGVTLDNLLINDIKWGKLDNKFKDKYHNNKSKSNRSLFKELKNSYEKRGDIIEANKFYALEMNEREKELESDRKEGENLLEWLVFKTHGLASNHSQNWILPLFWILLFAMLTGLFQNYYLNGYITNVYPTSSSILGYLLFILSVPFFIDKIIERKPLKSFTLSLTLMISGLYLLITKDILLELPAKVINPFSLMNNSEYINGIELIIKIIIAYLIYQLIISIRQNTRRK